MDDQAVMEVAAIQAFKAKVAAASEAEHAAKKVDVIRLPNAPSALLNSGARIPLIGLGTWKAAKGEVEKAVGMALRAGYTHIDCASIYENEAEVGNALVDVFTHTSLKREEIFITTKLWNTEHAPDRVEFALRKSLKALQLEYVDLYMIHWPVAGNRGPVVEVTTHTYTYETARRIARTAVLSVWCID